jgi:hypothetical protein
MMKKLFLYVQRAGFSIGPVPCVYVHTRDIHGRYLNLCVQWAGANEGRRREHAARHIVSASRRKSWRKSSLNAITGDLRPNLSVSFLSLPQAAHKPAQHAYRGDVPAIYPYAHACTHTICMHPHKKLDAPTIHTHMVRVMAQSA